MRMLQRLRHSFIRKLILAIIIVAIVIPLSFFGYKNITGMHPTLDENTLRDLFYEQINMYRTSNNLDPFSKSLKLQTIAQEHSQSMAKEDIYFRNHKQEFQNNKLYCTFQNEIILKTENTDLIAELNETQLSTLLDPKLERIGIGVAINKSIFITQDFCG